MSRPPIRSALVLAVVVALGACHRDEPVATAPPPPTPAATAPAPAPPPPAGGLTIAGVEFGRELGADDRIAEPTMMFAPDDAVIAAVTTANAEPAAATGGMLAAKLTYEDGAVLFEESRALAGAGTSTFLLDQPGDFQIGRYTLELTLDGAPPTSREFDVRR